jgi:galactoside O-acetyltransferase
MTNSFYTIGELAKLQIKKIGMNVSISRKCSIYSPSSLIVGNNVRIDDFCILSGDISVGNYVHISAYCALYGSGGIIIGDFCGLSPRSTIFSRGDDFSGNYMISPMVPERLINPYSARVVLKNYSQLGTNTIVMPGVVCNEGSVTGAFSFVTEELEEWSINCGIPAKKIKNRERKPITLAMSIKNYE